MCTYSMTYEIYALAIMDSYAAKATPWISKQSRETNDGWIASPPPNYTSVEPAAQYLFVNGWWQIYTSRGRRVLSVRLLTGISPLHCGAI